MSYSLRFATHVHELIDLSQAQETARDFAAQLGRPVTVFRDDDPFCTYHPTTCPHCEGHAKKVTAEFHNRE